MISPLGNIIISILTYKYKKEIDDTLYKTIGESGITARIINLSRFFIINEITGRYNLSIFCSQLFVYSFL